MAGVDNAAGGKTTGNGEITFADVVKFLRRNWKPIALLTVILSAVAVTALLLWPKEYQKNLTLKADLDPTSELLSRIERQGLTPQDQIGNQAVISLRSRNFREVEVQSRYDSQTKLVALTLQSRDEDALAGIATVMTSFLKNELSSIYQDTFDDVMQTRITRLGGVLEEKREVLDRLERESGDSASEAEATALVTVASVETDLENAEQTRENLPRLTAEALSVEVASESDVRRSRVPTALYLLAVAASLAAAVAFSLFREAFARDR